MSDASHVRLLHILRLRSVRRGTFTLASGRQSDLYVDVRQTSLNAEGCALIGGMLLDRLHPSVEAIGGLTLGADPLACAAAALSWGRGRPVHAFLVRKEAKGHGGKSDVEGTSSLRDGMKVAIVEDTTTTGQSLLTAVERARAIGLDVVQTITVVDREEGAREALAAHGLTLEALATRTELLS